MTEPSAPGPDSWQGPGSWQGRELELVLGAVAHGGHVVARHEGRVIFVRHGLPGERVAVRITEDKGGSFCRGDAIEILVADPDRVQPACPHARPAGCGGCDFQHVRLDRQRQLKADVVAEQLSRLAGLIVEVTVQNLDAEDSPQPDGGPAAGLGWRRKVRYASDAGGRLGLRAHRSHTVIEMASCPLATAAVGDVAAIRQHAASGCELELAQGDDGPMALTRYRTDDRRQPSRARNGTRRRVSTRAEHLSGPATLSYQVNGRPFQVQATGFWQTHPAAAATFSAAVTEGLALQPGQRALDLYAGAGLFTAALAVSVGPSGRVIGVEAAAGAVEDATANLADLTQAQVRQAAVTRAGLEALASELGGVEAVVLDPPRSGAGAELMRAITTIASHRIAYVACDPAALARDLRAAMDSGWELAQLHAYDAFPMTHHVECIAIMRPVLG